MKLTACREHSGGCHTHQVAVERWGISGDPGLPVRWVRIATNLCMLGSHLLQFDI